MATSFSCKCIERHFPIELRNWAVINYKCNYSAFNGYHRTPSEYSTVVCRTCGVSGRTKGEFVNTLMHFQRYQEAIIMGGKWNTVRDNKPIDNDNLKERLEKDNEDRKESNSSLESTVKATDVLNVSGVVLTR